MTTQDRKQAIAPLQEVLSFLLGDGPLRGIRFGGKPDDERGMYWWRKDLRAAMGTSPVSAEPQGAAKYGDPREVAARIEQWIGQYGKENSATLMLYEAMKALRNPAFSQQPAQAAPEIDFAQVANMRADLKSKVYQRNLEDAAARMLDAGWRKHFPNAASSPASEQDAKDALRCRVEDAIAEALGDAYDCVRVWEAWHVGTMSQDDFRLVSCDADRVAEIADAAITAMGGAEDTVKCPGCGERGELNGKDGEYRCGSGLSSGCTR